MKLLHLLYRQGRLFNLRQLLSLIQVFPEHLYLKLALALAGLLQVETQVFHLRQNLVLALDAIHKVDLQVLLPRHHPE